MKTANPHLARWELLSSDKILSTPWFTITKKHMRTSKGAELDYYVHSGADGVVCVCQRDDGKILIERQYRPTLDKVCVDFPGGRADMDDPTPEMAMLRELEEEAGFSATKMTKLAVIDMNPGYSSDRCYLFVAQGSIDRPSDQEETEDIVLEWRTPQEVLAMFDSGEMACAFCTSALFFAFRHLGLLTFDK